MRHFSRKEMSKVQVEKLRKVLVWVFALLSVVFACVAIFRHFEDADKISSRGVFAPSPKKAEWGRDLESLARSEGRLVFFRDSRCPIPPGDDGLEGVLERHYIEVPVDFAAWPGDYCVLDNLFFMFGGGKSRVKMGVLSPRMSPLFLFSDSYWKDPSKPPLSSVLAAVARKYGDSRSELRRGAESAVERVSGRVSTLRSLSPGLWARHMAASECISLYSDFSSLSAVRAPAGLLSSNARLAARLERLEPSPISRHNADMAALTLASRLEAKSETLTSRLLFARALSELAYAGCGREVLQPLDAFASRIEKKLSKGGFLRDAEGVARLRDSALAVSFLTREFMRTRKYSYLLAATKCARGLEGILRSRSELPALADSNKDSQGSSFEYALAASAFVDMHLATSKESWIISARDTLEDWFDKFETSGGLYSVNSADSPLASLMRPVIFNDELLPSYLGEAAQAAVYLASRGVRVRCLSELAKLSEVSCQAGPLASYARASLKLAGLSGY